MRVILLADIRGTGRKGDVKEVREGYARNFLIRRGLAAPATEIALAAKAREEETKEARRVERRRAAEIAAGKFTGFELTFPIKAGPGGEVYGSVTAKNIEETLAARGCRDVTVKLPKVLKILGAHRVELDFGEGIKAIVGVTLVRED
ncbi:MAG: 50S ribosomal protein L9 [Candidatus Brennerbacteria bacterium]|nr:50S ribosomal protein L9 [Candidatus Brennerbacteria bacterium]